MLRRFRCVQIFVKDLVFTLLVYKAQHRKKQKHQQKSVEATVCFHEGARASVPCRVVGATTAA